MLNSIDNNVVNKLKQIVSARFGKSIEVRQLCDLSGENQSQESAYFMKGSTLHIPIVCNGERLGTAVVANADELNSDIKTNISQVVRMALEPTMYNWYLQRKEANIQEILKANDDSSIADSDLSNSDLFEEWVSDESYDSPQLLSNLLHLQGTNDNLIKKVALQLHEMTHRWAFVPWSDINNQIKSVEDLLKLGAMSVFIEKLENLSGDEQTIILNFMELEHTDEHPIIITSSKLPIHELEVSIQLDPHLIDEISVNMFEVDRAPLSFQSLKEVLELFFFRTDKELDS